MSFDKSYTNRKDKREPYRGAGKCDRTCRPNGGCPYCERGRLHNNEKKLKTAKEKENEFETD